MRRRVLLVIVAFGIPIVGHAADMEVRRQTLPNCDELVYRLSEITLARVPTWEPASEDPPLSIRQAVRVARTEIKRADPSKVLIVGIDLGCARVAGTLRWYYFITAFDKTEAAGDVPPKTHDVLVLMNREVIRPVLESAGIRQ